MRNFLGIIMILSGLAFGAYVGLWVCMIGGIVDMVNNFPHDVGGVCSEWKQVHSAADLLSRPRQRSNAGR